MAVGHVIETTSSSEGPDVGKWSDGIREPAYNDPCTLPPKLYKKEYV